MWSDRLKDFEDELARKVDNGEVDSVKSYWIREALDTEPMAPYDMYQNYERFVHISKGKYELSLQPGTYDSMRRYIYILKRLGLIELDHKESSDRGGFDKHIYTLSRYNSVKWDNPQKHLYGD